MKNEFPIIAIEEARDLPMETRMQLIETLLHSIALDAEEMSDAMEKLSFAGASTLARTLKDEFALEFRHILKRLFWGAYEEPHVKDFYFGLIPNTWLRQYQLASNMRDQSQNNPHTLTYAGSVISEQTQNESNSQAEQIVKEEPSLDKTEETLKTLWSGRYKTSATEVEQSLAQMLKTQWTYDIQ